MLGRANAAAKNPSLNGGDLKTGLDKTFAMSSFNKLLVPRYGGNFLFQDNPFSVFVNCPL